MSYDIGALVRERENDYISGNTSLGKYVEFSQYDTIEKIDAYVNSKHTSGLTDSQGREKPFFNIVNSALNIWYRATDIDRKDIRIKATSSKTFLGAFLATIYLRDWMRRNNFGVFLNDWGRALARYGSAVVKFVEKNGILYVKVVPWNTLITDTIDFDNNPKIEKLYYTPAQLKKNKNYDQDAVKGLLDSLQERETIEGTRKDTVSDYIEVYEVHGELELSYITGKDADKDTFVQQMHVISFTKGEDGEYNDFTLYKGREAKDPYMITHLIKEDGRSLGIGAVEHLFESQWMVNHSAKSIKDMLDICSKVVFQTADASFVGNNVLTNLESGDIMIHAENKPLTQVNNASHDITSLQSYAQQWQVLAKEITSTPDAITGNTMPSGTAYRTVAILNKESHSLFEIMTENKGLAIEDMLRTHVIPHLKKKMNNAKEISAKLEDHEINFLDTAYIRSEVLKRRNKKVRDAILKQNGQGGELAVFNEQETINQIRSELDAFGNERFIKSSEYDDIPWSQVFKDLEWEVEVEVTGEDSDKQTTLATLTSIFQTIVANPDAMSNPDAKLIFNKILDATGSVSPVEMHRQQKKPTPTQVGTGKVGELPTNNLVQNEPANG